MNAREMKKELSGMGFSLERAGGKHFIYKRGTTVFRLSKAPHECKPWHVTELMKMRRSLV